MGESDCKEKHKAPFGHLPDFWQVLPPRKSEHFQLVLTQLNEHFGPRKEKRLLV